MIGIDLARAGALVGMMATHLLGRIDVYGDPTPVALVAGKAAALFAVQRGAVHFERLYRGRPVTVGNLGARRVFGEVSFLSGEGASATAVADDDEDEIDAEEEMDYGPGTRRWMGRRQGR